MVANIRGYTPNYGFKLVNFDTPRWHTLEYANWSLLDSMLLQAGIPNIRGDWLNSTLYIIGDRVFDIQTGDLYRCLVQHTSAASGTFSSDRIAHPTYWAIQLAGVPLFRGDWLPNAVYALGDIVVVNSYDYYLCVAPHTSSTTFPPDSAYWETVFSASDVVADANAAASDAATSASEAANSANEAASSAADAADSANVAASAQSAFKWLYDSSTVSGDPGVGNLRFNSNVPVSVSYIYLSSQSADLGNPNVAAWIGSWDDSTNMTVKGTLYIRNSVSPENFLILQVSGPVLDIGTWQQVSVTYVGHGGSVTSSDAVSVGFVRAGDAGNSGSGSGDMLAVNNLSDVADPIAAADNIGVGPSDTPSFIQAVLANAPTVNGHAATKLYVDNIAASVTATYAPINNAALTGNPTAPTPTANDNDTSIATTAFVTNALTTKVSKATDTMTGSLNIAPVSVDPLLTLDKPASGNANVIQGRKGGLARWSTLLGDYTVESTGNLGSNFQLVSYNDAGVALNVVLTGRRSTGLLEVANDPTVPLGIATKGYVDAGNSTLTTAIGNKVTKSGDTMTGNLTMQSADPTIYLNHAGSGHVSQIYGQSNGVVRWLMRIGDQDAETGGNAGASFNIYSYNDAGTNLGMPLSISRATGKISINGNPNNPNEVCNKAYADTKFPYSGGTFSGAINAPGISSSAGVSASGSIGASGGLSASGWSYFGAGYQVSSYSDRWQSDGYIIVSNNGLKPGGGSWVDTSDARIKTISGAYEHGLAEIIKIEPVRYTYKNNVSVLTNASEQSEDAREAPLHANVVGREFVGVIAQQVEDFLPETVTLVSGLIDGKPVDDLRVYDSNALIYALVNAVKELSARVEALEANVP